MNDKAKEQEPAPHKFPGTQDFYGTKRITAWPSNKEGKDGYIVKYADGYTSWSPKDVFEAAYQPLTALSFGHAIVAMKAGNKVARAGWNGKGMWLYLVPANSYPAQTEAAKEYWKNKEVPHTFVDSDKSVPMVPYGAYIAMKTAQENVVPWLASQTDMLSDDWQVVD